MKKVDYSSDAITRRLKQVDQLRVLCLSLEKAKKAHDERAKDHPDETPPRSAERDPDVSEAT